MWNQGWAVLDDAIKSVVSFDWESTPRTRPVTSNMLRRLSEDRQMVMW